MNVLEWKYLHKGGKPRRGIYSTGKFRWYTTYRIHKEFSGEGGINIIQKFSGGSLHSSGMKVEDAISDLSSLRVIKMKGACNRSNTMAFQHQKPGGCYKVVEIVNRTRYLEQNRWAIVKGRPQSEQPKQVKNGWSKGWGQLPQWKLAQFLDLHHVKNQTLHTEYNKPERRAYCKSFDL